MHISNPTVNLSADANCQSKDLFNTSPTNLEPIYVSSTLPIPAGNYDFYLVRDKSSWKDGDPICPVGASDGLIAYYPFNGNANDESGNGNHGTVNGALLTSDSAGNANSAYGFNGIDSYITVGDKLDAQNGDLTLSAWVKADTYAQSAIIINKGMTSNGSPPGCGYGLHVLQESPVQTAGIHFRFDDSDYGIRRDVFIPVNQVPIARFIFLTGTLRHIDSSTVQMSIYLNGKLYSSKTFPSGPANDTNIPFAIGAHYRGEYGPVTAFFNGVIDEVKVYNRSLSDAEVQELYNQPTCITSKSISIDNNGHFCDLLWTPPVGDNNQYDIVLDVNGNGFFDIATDFLDSNIAVGATTLVELTSFTALPKSGKVTLNWTTESEIDNAGFNIYRAETENGSYIKINAALISTKGSSTQGASYEFVDNDVQNRKTYYYKLEDIDLEGKSTMHGPVSATPRLIHVLSK